MSKLFKKLGNALSPKSKSTSAASSSTSGDLQVDAVPTTEVVPSRENAIAQEVNPRSLQNPSSWSPQTQANQFNSPTQTVYQFNNTNGVHIGNSYTINQNLTQEIDQEDHLREESKEEERTQTTSTSSSVKKKFPKTRTIELLLKSDKELEHPDMDIISTHLGEDWRSVARDLGFSNGEIDHFYEDNFAFGVKEVIYKFLSEWKQREEEPTLGKICQILWARHREVVYQLKLEHKKRQS